MSHIIFTRYLYLKDEVEIALLASLLNKKDDALFWAFELYFSGFESELIEILWKIYYEFYYSLNPSFECYFLKKHKQFLSSSPEEKHKIIGMLFNDLLIRKYNLDVFLLKHVISSFEIENSDETLLSLLKKKNYENLALLILETAREEDLENIIAQCLDYFAINHDHIPLNREKIIKDLKKVSYKNKRIVILSRIMNYYCLCNGIKMGKSLYVSVDIEDTIMYETIYKNDEHKLYHWQILSIACIYGTNDHNYLGLFKLKRNINKTTSIKPEYWYHWLYHAAFSPIWGARIKDFGGILNHETKKIDFPDDDILEEFCENYGYEPDEQKLEVQKKNIPDISNEITWAKFHEIHKNNSLYNISQEQLVELEEIVL